eukprot:CAMPEP_0113947280 /NCGR_PEP_ID=MMETSP1339-20121228/63627_1 /TAXON_ID=94617 /ORGANISM="Fibrocapsa japonica" /LENGTH=62 /DNA_ID=CAMNT_0000953789 /DNA_START=358 /DNA_END=546 /DNA_ORIENTATION=- /assembly_acc=CAM_ASM_000762
MSEQRMLWLVTECMSRDLVTKPTPGVYDTSIYILMLGCEHSCKYMGTNILKQNARAPDVFLD